jgi:hypothetical protein
VTQGQAAFLIYRTDADGVLLFAIPATPQIPLAAFASLGILHLVDSDRAALHTAGSIAPTLVFKELHCRVFISTGYWYLCDCDGFRDVMP